MEHFVCRKGEKKGKSLKISIESSSSGSWVKVGQDQNAKDRGDIRRGWKKENGIKKAFH